VALLLPAVQSARETARKAQCSNNIKQLSTALMNMDTQRKKLPGYVNEIPDPTSPKDPLGRPTIGRRASWIVMIFPYMENTAVYDQWNANFTANTAPAPATAGLTCPTNPPESQTEPWLQYVGNAGQAFSDGTRVDSPGRPGNAENPADGVFIDDNRNPNFGATDGRGDGSTAANLKDYPRLSMSLAYVNSNDGTSKTLMISENMHAWYWTYETADSSNGTLVQNDNSTIKDAKHLFGFVWKNRPNTSVDPQGIERVNGDKFYDKNVSPATMADYANVGNSIPALYESYGYPSSKHPGGVNVGYCDGHITFLPETVDPGVYAMLMTSNRTRSNFKDYTNGPSGVPDRQAKQPSESDL
jgi:prepilin-type processing-associated H-X9-DG protein